MKNIDPKLLQDAIEAALQNMETASKQLLHKKYSKKPTSKVASVEVELDPSSECEEGMEEAKANQSSPGKVAPDEAALLDAENKEEPLEAALEDKEQSESSEDSEDADELQKLKAMLASMG